MVDPGNERYADSGMGKSVDMGVAVNEFYNTVCEP